MSYLQQVGQLLQELVFPQLPQLPHLEQFPVFAEPTHEEHPLFPQPQLFQGELQDPQLEPQLEPHPATLLPHQQGRDDETLHIFKPPSVNIIVLPIAKLCD